MDDFEGAEWAATRVDEGEWLRLKGKFQMAVDMVRFGVVEQEMLLGKMVCGMVRFADVGMLLVAIEVVDMELVAIGVYNAAVENLEDFVKVDYIVEQ